MKKLAILILVFAFLAPMLMMPQVALAKDDKDETDVVLPTGNLGGTYQDVSALYPDYEERVCKFY